jgi:hypothetical protein
LFPSFFIHSLSFFLPSFRLSFLFFLHFFWNRISLCGSYWPQSCYVV